MTRAFRYLVLAAALAASPAAAQPRAKAATPPSPEQVLGFRPGADGKLAEWSQITGYFDGLARGSERVRVEKIGSSVEGRPMLLATISSPANLRRLEEIRRTQARLADPRGLSAAEIERLTRTQPAVVLIGASLHGNEIMATQMSMELAHQLATDATLAPALENVVVLLVPGMNPDGLDITRDWWLRTRGTPNDGAPMPWLYHYYTGHDNNRDFFMVTQPETQAVTRVLYERVVPAGRLGRAPDGQPRRALLHPPLRRSAQPEPRSADRAHDNLVGVQMAAGPRRRPGRRASRNRRPTISGGTAAGAHARAPQHGRHPLRGRQRQLRRPDPAASGLAAPAGAGSMFPEPGPAAGGACATSSSTS